MNDTRDQLRLLSTFHYVLAGLTALLCFFPALYVVMGISIVAGQVDGSRGPPPALGWLVAGMGVFMFLAGMTLAVLLLLAARYLRTSRHWMYCMVIAGLSCALFPFGTVLGVFSIVTLSKPEVKTLFTPPHVPRPSGSVTSGSVLPGHGTYHAEAGRAAAWASR